MPSTVAVIVFHATSADTETVAMSAAVGAVQARALIRLRRMPEAAGHTMPSRAEDRDALARMQKEYVAPTEADVLGADAILIVPPPSSSPDTGEWQPFVSMLARLAAEGRLTGKVAAVVHAGDGETVAAFAKALVVPGLIMVPPGMPGSERDLAETATLHGRHVASLAATLKPSA
jgi:hypothetical protein